MARHLAAISIFLLATLAVTSYGAPVDRRVRHACGQGVMTESHTGQPRVRHGLMEMIKAAETQIEVAISHFNEQKKDINKYFDGVTTFNKTSYNYDWLPQKQVDWYKKICSLPKKIKVKKSFQAFNSSLQIFSATFKELKKFSPERKADDRNKIVGSIHSQLDQVLCEVEWNLICLNATTPATVTEDFLSKTENWNHNPDDTGLMMQDWGVISLFEAYLTDWNVIVSNLNNKKKNGCNLTTPTEKKKKSKRQNTKGKKTKKTKDKRKKSQES